MISPGITDYVVALQGLGLGYRDRRYRFVIDMLCERKSLDCFTTFGDSIMMVTTCC